MAAASLLEEFEKLVECPVCTEVMTDSRHLSCLHVFCTQCIQNLITESRDKHVPDITCPLCRVKSKTPERGTEGFPKACFQNNFGETVKRFKKITEESHCTVCPEGQEKEAQYVCLDCYETLCNDCKFYHAKFHSMHRTVVLTEMGKPDIERFLQNRKQKCPIHIDKSLEYFCRDCKQLGCVSCCIVTHKGHTVFEMGDAAAKHKEDLERLTVKFDQHVRACTDTNMKLDTLNETLERRHQNNKARVNRYFADFKTILDKEEAKLLQMMDRKKDYCSAILQTHNQTIRTDKQRYEQLGGYLKNIIHKGTAADICQSFVNDAHRLDIIAEEDRRDRHHLPNLDLHVGDPKYTFRTPSLLLVNEITEFMLPYKPAGMTATADGKLVVCEWHGARVNIYNMDGSIHGKLSIPISAKTWDVVCHGKLFIVTDFSGHIYVVKANGVLKHAIDTAACGLSKEIMSVSISNNTVYLSFNNDAAVYQVPTADIANGRVSKKALVHVLLDSMLPSCVDANSTRLVASFQNESKVKGYDTDGNELFTYGTSDGPGENELNKPTGVAMDPRGYVLIADTFNHRVVMLSPSGQLLGFLATEADGVRGPRTVTFGHSGEVFVSSGGRNGPWKVTAYSYNIANAGPR